MQKIGWIVAILCGVSWFASEIRLPSEVVEVGQPVNNVWRRTVDGWEKTNEWYCPVEKSPPALHPGVMGLLMIAVSLSVGITKSEPE